MNELFLRKCVVMRSCILCKIIGVPTLYGILIKPRKESFLTWKFIASVFFSNLINDLIIVSMNLVSQWHRAQYYLLYYTRHSNENIFVSNLKSLRTAFLICQGKRWVLKPVLERSLCVHWRDAGRTLRSMKRVASVVLCFYTTLSH